MKNLLLYMYYTILYVCVSHYTKIKSKRKFKIRNTKLSKSSLPTVCISLCTVSTCTCHLHRICCTLVPEIRVRPEMLCVFWSIDMLTCMIYNFHQQNIKDNWSYLLSSDKDR